MREVRLRVTIKQIWTYSCKGETWKSGHEDVRIAILGGA